MKKQKNPPIRSVTLIITLSVILLCGGVKAQDSWSKPTAGQNFLTRSSVTLQYNKNGNNRIKETQIIWYEATDNLNQKDNYYIKFPVSTQSCFDSGEPPSNTRVANAPCYGYQNIDPNNPNSAIHQNKAQVYYEEGNGSCTKFTKQYNTPVVFNIVTPIFPSPYPTGDLFICSDGSAEIEVQTINAFNTQTIGQTIKPSGLRWFRLDVNSQTYSLIFDDVTLPDGKSTLQYNFGPSSNVENLRCIPYWNNNGCIVDGVPLNLVVPTAASLPLNAPATQVITVCSEQQIDIEIPNPYNYDGVYWYNSESQALANTPILFDGFMYSFYHFGGFKEFYVQYYKKLDNDCIVRSVPIPIYVIGSYQTIIPLGINTIAKIQDHRNYSSLNCNDNDPTTPTHYDLENPVRYQDQVSEAIGLSFNNPCFDFEIQSTQLQWYVSSETEQGLLDYSVETNSLGETVYRVCGDHIRSANGPYGKKSYKLQANVKARIVGKGCGILDINEPYDCTFTLRFNETTVRVEEPGSITEINCEIPTFDIIEKMISVSSNCDQREYETVCEDNATITLGPTEQELRNYFSGGLPLPGLIEDLFEFEWIPSVGLSANNISNPTTSYNQLNMINDGQIKEYRCIVRVVGLGLPPTAPTEYNHCSYVYKCSSCQNTTEPIANPTCC